MDKAELIELENHLNQAAKSLRCAWKIMSRNGLENTAYTTADKVLDTEEAAKRVRAEIEESA